MLLTAFPAAAFGTNCYVVAPAPGEQCVVVDPGIGVLDDLAAVLAEHRLRPAAVLLTHGHLDHVYSVTPVCRDHGVPALVHGDDGYRLDDPLACSTPRSCRCSSSSSASGRAGPRRTTCAPSPTPRCSTSRPGRGCCTRRATPRAR